MTRETYCKNFCPQRFNSECWTDCDVEREEREQEIRDNFENDDCYEDSSFDDED
jgi:hypothetical protein